MRVSLCSVLLVCLLMIGWGVDCSNTLREKKKQMLGSVMTTWLTEVARNRAAFRSALEASGPLVHVEVSTAGPPATAGA